VKGGLSLVAVRDFPLWPSQLRNLRPYQPFADPRHPGGQLRFEDKFTCTTSDLIYVLSCRKCSKLYIGETGRRLGDRFREHIRSVGANTDLPVGKHFSSPGHSVGDMLVSVICAGFRTTMVRRSMEARLIFRHKTLQPNGMNIDFAFL